MSEDNKPNTNIALYRGATDAANVCRTLVEKTAVEIQGRRYVKVEGWTSIAVANGCIASIRSVDKVPGGIRAIAELRRISDGIVLSEADGFVGEDEPTWYGGVVKRVKSNREYEHVLPRRADYAIRAMAQTRAISRVCRTAFSHVVVMMEAGLSTVPYEEVGGGEDEYEEQPAAGQAPQTSKAETPPAPSGPTHAAAAPPSVPAHKPEEKKAEPKPPEVPRDRVIALRKQYEGGLWKGVRFHFGKNGPEQNPPDGLALGDLEDNSLVWWIENYQPKPFGRNNTLADSDLKLRAALDVAGEEAFKK
jgi:hypothetical protein